MPILNFSGHSQQLDWGSIRWLIEPGSSGSERVSAGLLSFNARSVQHEHVHIGYEQIMYVISGQGRHEVDGEAVELTPGSLVHIPPFARHAMYNEHDAPLTIISLYFPLRSHHLADDQEKTPDDEFENASIWTFLDMDALGVLLEKLSQALGFRLSLVDPAGNTIISSGNHPPFCAMLHAASKGRHCKKRLRQAIREGASERGNDTKKRARGILFTCCNAVTSVLIPVYSNKKTVGYIKCGEAFFSKSDRDAMADSLRTTAEKYAIPPENLIAAAADVRVELKSVLYAAAEATLAIANYIADMAATAVRSRELDKSRLSLAEEQMASAKLEKALQEADFKLLQSQINPHFLFNTLNTVAQMAYVEGVEKVANIIWSLSDLLRFTLRRSEELIPLQEELKLLNDYVHIQQARFGERLEIVWNVAPGLDDVLVPCMVLQPLVENAIIHGLEPRMEPGCITVSAKAEANMLCLGVRDNGVGFSPQADTKKSGHIGIASVRNRLQYYFADASSFVIESAAGRGTKVTIRLPLGNTPQTAEPGELPEKGE